MQFNVRIDATIVNAARVIAAAERQSMSAWVADLLVQKIRATDSKLASTVIETGQRAA